MIWFSSNYSNRFSWITWLKSLNYLTRVFELFDFHSFLDLINDKPTNHLCIFFNVHLCFLDSGIHKSFNSFVSRLLDPQGNESANRRWISIEAVRFESIQPLFFLTLLVPALIVALKVISYAIDLLKLPRSRFSTLRCTFNACSLIARSMHSRKKDIANKSVGSRIILKLNKFCVINRVHNAIRLINHCYCHCSN